METSEVWNVQSLIVHLIAITLPQFYLTFHDLNLSLTAAGASQSLPYSYLLLASRKHAAKEACVMSIKVGLWA